MFNYSSAYFHRRSYRDVSLVCRDVVSAGAGKSNHPSFPLTMFPYRSNAFSNVFIGKGRILQFWLGFEAREILNQLTPLV